MWACLVLGVVRPPTRTPFTRRAVIGGAVCSQHLFVPTPSWAVPNPLCDQDVSVLTTSSKQIVIVGTSHVSEESATLVRQVIQLVKPDTVMVELDKRRAVALMRTAKARRNGEQMVAATALAEQQSRGAAFYEKLETMGLLAGGEFVAAIEEARLLNATVLLGDRDINVTLQRLQEAKAELQQLRADGILTREDAKAALSSLPSSLSKRSPALTAEDVTQMATDLRQRGNAREVAAYLKLAEPPVYAAMVGERDRIMAHALEAAPGSSVVGVVGLAHLDGIERILGEEVTARPSRSCHTRS